MSKKLAIMEGDMARKFSGVKYLRTNLQNGKTCDWVPEDEYKLTTKRITKNGTYKASDEKDKNKKSYYGFSQVTVSVKQATTGKKNDGNTYSVKTDDQGNIVEFILADTIKVVTPPQKTEYKDGESILVSGMVVKAYRGDGQEWDTDGYPHGVIPLNEISIDPNSAVYTGGGAGIAYKDIPKTGTRMTLTGNAGVLSSIFENELAKMHTYEDDAGVIDIIRQHLTANYNRAGFVDIVYNSSNFGGWSPIVVFICTSINEGDEFYTDRKYNGIIISSYASDKHSYDEPWRITRYSVRNDVAVLIPGYNTSNSRKYSALADLSIGSQEITVNWPRFDDEEILSDTFNITVT